MVWTNHQAAILKSGSKTVTFCWNPDEKTCVNVNFHTDDDKPNRGYFYKVTKARELYKELLSEGYTKSRTL